MATVLISGEVSPVVRFGIRQHRSGALRACSPCCERSMEGPSLKCKGCGRDWSGTRPSAYQLDCGVIVIPGNDGMLRALHEWAEAATGLSLKLSVSD